MLFEIKDPHHLFSVYARYLIFKEHSLKRKKMSAYNYRFFGRHLI